MGASYQVRKNVFIRDGGRCQRCGCDLYLDERQKNIVGKKKAYTHHIKFKRDGGEDIEDNLLLTCWDCEIEFHRQWEFENGKAKKSSSSNKNSK